MFRSGLYWNVVIILCTLQVPASLLSQQIDRNDHVRYEVKIVEENYEITYRFIDHFNNYQTYTLSMPFAKTNQLITKFGIPRWLFEPYVDSEENRYYRELEMAKGLFRLNDNTIEVDKSAVLNYYSEMYAKPIAEMIVSSLADYGQDTRRNRIEFAMRFIQDIPYGVPDYQDEERHYGGVHVPPQLLIKGYGDCDSKVLLFVGILTYLIPSEDIIFLNQSEHVLSAILEEPDKGLTFVKFQNEKYLIAETSGPGKRMLGQKGNYYKEKFVIESLKITPTEVIPYAEPSKGTIYPSIANALEDNILMLRNKSSREFEFQISPDNHRWENLNLPSNQSGRYIFKSKVKIFLRFRESRRKYATYQVSTGNSYTIVWNSRRSRWEISSVSI